MKEEEKKGSTQDTQMSLCISTKQLKQKEKMKKERNVKFVLFFHDEIN